MQNLIFSHAYSNKKSQSPRGGKLASDAGKARLRELLRLGVIAAEVADDNRCPDAARRLALDLAEQTSRAARTLSALRAVLKLEAAE